MQSMKIGSISVLLSATLFLAARANAAFVVDITPIGSDVVATGSGTIDTTGLTLIGPYFGPPGISPATGFLKVGVAVTDSDQGLTYSGFSGPSSFGTGNYDAASSGTGGSVGIDDSIGFLYVPPGYVSGSALSDNAALDNETVASLGLTPGTSSTWTWGSGRDADSFTINISAAPTVPEPALAIPVALASGMLLLFASHISTLATRRRGCADGLPENAR